MTEFQTINDVLTFAISNEQRASEFYTDLAEKANSSAMKKAFTEFAAEEKGHKAKLQRLLDSGEISISNDKVLDLKISDYTIDMQASPDMSYQDVLILAMKREKAAYRLYNNLSFLASDEEVSKTFKLLAQEEAKHKLRFEIEYDDKIMGEN